MRVRLVGGAGEISGSQIWKGRFIFFKPPHFFLVMGTNLKVKKTTAELLSSRGATREGMYGF
jgi:hypothetical protein